MGFSGGWQVLRIETGLCSLLLVSAETGFAKQKVRGYSGDQDDHRKLRVDEGDDQSL